MGISDEALESKKYEFETYDEEELFGNKNVALAKLSRENVAKIEAIIKLDSNYAKSSDINAAPRKKNSKDDLDISDLSENELKSDFNSLSYSYGGSTAWWFKQFLNSKFQDSTNLSDIRFLVSGAVAAVDRENSTHLNSTSKVTQNKTTPIGRTVITERICRRCITIGGLKERLKNDDFTEEGLLSKLAELIDIDVIKELVDKSSIKCSKERTNLSFASKFCHYASFYLFDKDEYRDRYSIFDREVGRLLPYYLSSRHLNLNLPATLKITRNMFVNDQGASKKQVSYALYHECIGQVIKNSNISRNGFDHLLWYYYKGKTL
jgi:hypothetical protein